MPPLLIFLTLLLPLTLTHARPLDPYPTNLSPSGTANPFPDITDPPSPFADWDAVATGAFSMAAPSSLTWRSGMGEAGRELGE